MENFEITFYKVIHTPLLFKKILNYINSIDWIEYNKIDNLNNDDYLKSKKFKDIISLDYIVNRKLFSLLKLKLKSNEYLILNTNLNWINELEDKKEIFQCFLNNNSIKDFDYINDNLIELDQELVEVAINEPYSIKINLSTLKKVFNHPTISMNKIKFFIESFFILNIGNQDLINEAKNKLIKMVIYEIKCIFKKDSILDFLFSNENYFNNLKTKKQKSFLKFLKKTHKSNNNNGENECIDDLEEYKIDIEHIVYSINSNEIQNKLFDNHYFKIKSKNILPFKEQILKIIKLKKGNVDTRVSKLINLFKDNSIKLYVRDENYENIFNNIEYLDSYLSNNQSDFKSINEDLKTLFSTKRNELVNGNDFIKYYLNLDKSHFFINKNFDNFIWGKMKKYLKENKYQIIKDIISIDNNNNEIINLFKKLMDNSIQTSKYLIVDEKEIIDLLKINNISLKEHYIVIGNLELIEYCISNDKYSQHYLNPSELYFYLIKDSINNGNMERLITISDKFTRNNWIGNFGFDINYCKLKSFINDDPTNISNVLNIFNYTITKKHTNLEIENCINLLNHSLLSNNTIHFDENDNELWNIIFYYYLYHSSSKNLLKLLNNNFNPIFTQNLDQFLKNNYIKTYVKEFDLNLLFKYEKKEIYLEKNKKLFNQSIDETIDCMESLINNYNFNLDKLKDRENSFLVLENIINDLFSNLIQHPLCTFDKTKYIYNSIKKNTKIKIRNSEEHSFYYLYLFSPKTIQFFKTIPDFLIEKNNKFIFNEIFKKIIDIKIFTMEYLIEIQNTDTIINQIVDNCLNSIKNNEIDKNNFNFNSNYRIINRILNSSLKYFIFSKREDLLLQSIKTIKNLKSSDIKFNKKVFDIDTIATIQNFEPEYSILLENNIFKDEFLNHIKYDLDLKQIKPLQQSFNCFFNENINYLEAKIIKYHYFYFSNTNQNSNIYGFENKSIEEVLLKLPIEFYCFLINTYPNQKLISISNNLIDLAIVSNKIYWLKYLIQNNYFNDININYLKQKLINNNQISNIIGL